MNVDRHGLSGEGSGDGGHLTEMMRAEAELLSSHDTHQVIADRLGISLNIVQIWCKHLVQRSRLEHCTHIRRADGKSEQQPSWNPYGQQDPRQGQASVSAAAAAVWARALWPAALSARTAALRPASGPAFIHAELAVSAAAWRAPVPGSAALPGAAVSGPAVRATRKPAALPRSRLRIRSAATAQAGQEEAPSALRPCGHRRPGSGDHRDQRHLEPWLIG